MIGVSWAYGLAGLIFVGIGLLSARDRQNAKRWKNTVFWGLFGLSFLFGSLIGDFANGLLVIALALLAGFGGLGQGRPVTTDREARVAGALRWGDRLFLVALIVPAVTLLGSLVLKGVKIGAVPLIDPQQATVVSLALGVIVALAAAMAMLKPPPLAVAEEARRLMDSVGWPVLLPQTLAALGAVFAVAGVGPAVSDLITRLIPVQTPLAAVLTYTIGMAVFTIIMGNAFAAFPVMTAGVGLPLIVRKFGGDPAIMGSVGMLAGYCGTLMTPMAANFNIVPAALLELPDRNGVIAVQVPTGVLMLIGNTLLMYFLVFRF